mmetsp:Transcript_86409/g.264425  ORF Transcript_86409/g.264425 Transcript_86409/m.264425 type:complete len:276 (+) Transcript_86409:335-1162(+)
MYCIARWDSCGHMSKARTTWTPKAWHARDATAPACSMSPAARHRDSSGGQCSKALSRTWAPNRCLASLWMFSMSAGMNKCRCLRKPFDNTEVTMRWPNLWKHNAQGSSESTSSTIATVCGWSAANSSKRQTTLQPKAFNATARALSRISDAMKPLASVPKRCSKASSTRCAEGCRAASSTRPRRLSAIWRASAGLATSRACLTTSQLSSSKHNSPARAQSSASASAPSAPPACSAAAKQPALPAAASSMSAAQASQPQAPPQPLARSMHEKHSPP